MSDYPIIHLSDEQAWHILQSNQIGRIATAREGAPEIYPVSYIIHDWKIYFRTGTESRLRRETEGKLVAFEAATQMLEDFSSTVVLGTTRALGEPGAGDELDQIPIVDFAPNVDYIWMEIKPEVVRGRQLLILNNEAL